MFKYTSPRPSRITAAALGLIGLALVPTACSAPDEPTVPTTAPTVSVGPATEHPCNSPKPSKELETSLAANKLVKKTYDHLRDRDVPRAVAIALTAATFTESGSDPKFHDETEYVLVNGEHLTRDGEYGFGPANWQEIDTFAKERGRSPRTTATQMDYVLQNISDEDQFPKLKDLNSVTNPADADALITRNYQTIGQLWCISSQRTTVQALDAVMPR